MVAMNKIIQKAKAWTEKVAAYVSANSGSNAKLIYGYARSKLAGLKVAKGYVKQVDEMLEKLGPDDPQKMFDKLAAKFESAVKILSLSAGTQPLSKAEVETHKQHAIAAPQRPAPPLPAPAPATIQRETKMSKVHPDPTPAPAVATPADEPAPDEPSGDPEPSAPSAPPLAVEAPVHDG